MGKRLEEVCPHCHSSKILLVEEKRRKLAQELRHAIMSIHYGHTKLREFNSRLVAAKRLLVSLRMANFLHYRWLEEKMESIQGDVDAVKNRITNQAEIVARQIAAETRGLIDYNSWTTGQFPFIEGVTNRLTHLGNQYKHNVDEAIGDTRFLLDDISKQLEGLDYYRKHFAGFYDLAELSVNELPVCALPEIKVTGSDFLKNDKATGTLFITNKRLLFVAETGLVRRRKEIIFDFPLIYLKSIEEDGRIRKRLVLRLKQGDLKLSCSEQTEKVLPDYIEIARKFDKYVQTDLKRVRRLEQTDSSISDVRLKIEGLVYSLLSTNSKAPHSDSTQSIPYRPSEPSAWPIHTRDRSMHDLRRQPTDYRDRLERTIDRGYSSRINDQYPDRGQISSLKRDSISLDTALRETVYQFRDGRLVPEEFIKRYKGLMRDSYQTRKRIDLLSRDNSDRW
ncbi:MAG: hypothetical protein ACW97A_08345 [Candidatus Thorarchaeota archaeon]|jgi:hypothetical protein